MIGYIGAAQKATFYYKGCFCGEYEHTVQMNVLNLETR